MTDVEILWSDGCPHHQAARELVEDVLRARGREPDIGSVRIGSDAEARAHRFAGSPTVRVGGCDVEPGFTDPGDYALVCRMYATSGGLRGVPERRWIEDALDRPAPRRKNMVQMTKRATTDEVSRALDHAGPDTAIDPHDAKLMVRLLRRLSLGHPIPVDEVRQLASEVPGGDGAPGAILARSERDTDGSIIGLMGLSLGDHPHQISFGDRRLRAWCAWDTLFLPPILGERAIVMSHDPANHTAISLTVSTNGVETASPEGALLSVVTPDLRGSSDAASVQALFCQFVHFFTDAAAAERWFSDRETSAYLLTLDEGFELGRTRLADLRAQAFE